MDNRFYMRRYLLEDKILNCTERGITDEKYCDEEIIISLTSYGRRVWDVCYTIESLMQQTMKANKIVLWLDPSSQAQPLPSALQRQMKRGLTVVVVEDIRSYKKLIPALKAYPDAAIVTVDDDIIYDFDIVERLINAYRCDKKSIHACRVHTMTFDKKGNLKPYNEWDWCKASPSPARNFVTGGGGTLYPPRSLAPQVLDVGTFTSICPTADDVWFNAMARLNGTPIHKVVTRTLSGEDYLANNDVADMGLCNINTQGECLNDRQIKAVFTKYGIYDLIK